MPIGTGYALSRRTFLGALAAVTAPAALAGCGFLPSTANDAGPNGLSFTTWGTDSELAGFRAVIAAFERAHPGATVKLNAVPYDQMFTNLDAQIQAGNAPDIFRVPYYTLGLYAGRGQLLDLRRHLPRGIADRFTPAAWAAVQSGDTPVGVPHHTDTSVLLYNRELLARAGVRNVPRTVDEAWTWDRFAQVLSTLRAALPDDRYPLVVNWQGNGVTRWLNWLFQADGRLLQPDLRAPAVDSEAGRAAVDYTRRFFARQLVPANSSVKSTSLAADIWFSQTAALTFAGAFLLPDAVSTATFDWGATFAPRRDRAGGDFGGNALVATSGTSKPGLAAQFLAFVTEEQPMHDFCVGASLIPTRRDLAAGGIRFRNRPELTSVFLDQARTVRAADAAQVASPSMTGIITVLQDQLERAFVGGQGTSATLDDLSAGITQALQR